MADLRFAMHRLALALVIGTVGSATFAQISRPVDGAGVLVPGPVNPPPGPGPVTPPPVPGPVTPPPIPGPVTPPPVRQLAYFVVINGQQQGPFDEAGLKAKAATGELVRTSLVWTVGMASWDEAGKVPDLAQILVNVPPKPKFDAAGFLAGTWQSDPQQIQVPNIGTGTIQGTTTYGRDGTMSAYATLDVVMMGTPARQTITASGTFTAVEQVPGKILVTPNTMVTFSMPGQPPQTDKNVSPFVVTVVDQNTAMSDEGIRSYRVGN